jgi:hypothetical protein
MNSKSSSTTVYWWIGWIVLTIVSFFISSSFWTPVIARHIGPMSQPMVPLIWVALVFGSWMVLLVPLIIVMYQKVDKAYEDARMTREENTYEKNKVIWGVQSVDLAPERRRLSSALIEKLRRIPEALKKGHLVHLLLKDGRRISYAFILGRKELLGVYDLMKVDFDAADIADIEPADLDKLPPFETDKWLRLDGVGSN